MTSSPVRWYSCGPTVYDHSHIGHARTYITIDMLRRIAAYKYGSIDFVMNITDVDDKIINNNVDPKFFENEFWNDMDTLNVQRPTKITRVTEYIPEIISFIERIIVNGFAYEINGSVYFDIQQYIAAGFKYILQNGAADTLSDSHSSEKKNIHDFALWKKTEKGISWESPWSTGRPGWHIECSVMASHVFEFGAMQFHSGGIDLAFPHHQNEVAQVNAYHAKDIQWVKQFVHTGHIHVQGLKMSKSLKNFITIKDALKKYSARELRLYFATKPYNASITYTDDAFSEIKALDYKISEYLNTPVIQTGSSMNAEFEEMIETDVFNVPAILQRIKQIVYDKKYLTIEAKNTVQKYTTLLGLDYTLAPLTDHAQKLIAIRGELRRIAKESSVKELFAITDDIRVLLQNMNVYIVDTPNGQLRVM